MNVSQDTRHLNITLDGAATTIYSYKGERNGVSITYRGVDLLGEKRPSLFEKSEATKVVMHAVNSYLYEGASSIRESMEKRRDDFVRAGLYRANCVQCKRIRRPDIPMEEKKSFECKCV